MTKEHISFIEEVELGAAVANELTQQQGETTEQTFARLRVVHDAGDLAIRAA
jgi:hypothetical protein